MTNPANPETPLSRIPFTPRAEASILELSKWMRIAGVIGMIAAVLKVLVALLVRNDIGQIIGSVVTFLIGYWSYQAAGHFAAVAKTDVADQQYLMQGFSLLRRVFLMQAALVIIGLGVLIVAVVGSAFYLMSR
jgi:membrane protein YqaA with SNARE-associated domain